MQELENIYEEIENEAFKVLKEEKISKESIEIIRSADICYAGQGHYVEVPLPNKGLQEKPKKEIMDLFHHLHEIKYGHRLDTPLRVINVRLKAVGMLKEIPMNEMSHGNEIPEKAVKSGRKVFMDGNFLECPIYEREELLYGNAIKGPAIIEEPQHTTIVMPGQILNVDKWGNLIIDLRGE
jgi:N-methylhydantoinase A